MILTAIVILFFSGLFLSLFLWVLWWARAPHIESPLSYVRWGGKGVVSEHDSSLEIQKPVFLNSAFPDSWTLLSSFFDATKIFRNPLCPYIVYIRGRPAQWISFTRRFCHEDKDRERVAIHNNPFFLQTFLPSFQLPFGMMIYQWNILKEGDRQTHFQSVKDYLPSLQKTHHPESAKTLNPKITLLCFGQPFQMPGVASFVWNSQQIRMDEVKRSPWPQTEETLSEPGIDVRTVHDEDTGIETTICFIPDPYSIDPFSCVLSAYHVQEGACRVFSCSEMMNTKTTTQEYQWYSFLSDWVTGNLDLFLFQAAGDQGAYPLGNNLLDDATITQLGHDGYPKDLLQGFLNGNGVWTVGACAPQHSSFDSSPTFSVLQLPRLSSASGWFRGYKDVGARSVPDFSCDGTLQWKPGKWVYGTSISAPRCAVKFLQQKDNFPVHVSHFPCNNDLLVDPKTVLPGFHSEPLLGLGCVS